MGIVDRALDLLRGGKASAARARAQAAAFDHVRMAYDGAAISRRTQGWRAVPSDANAEIGVSGQRLRDVARDMSRNNPHAARIKQVIAHNVVGTGILPSAQSPSDTARAALEELMKLHFDTTDIDADGVHTLYGIQNLVMQTVIESGECLVRMRPRRAEDGLAVPFQLQVLEPDHLDESVHGRLPNGNLAHRGIEFDRLNRRVAYHLFREHPGAASLTTGLQKSSRVPAEMVAHIFRPDRASQARGVTWFAPVIVRLRDIADFADAQLMRQKIAACYAAFVTTTDEPQNAAESDRDPYPVEQMTPGMIRYLEPGESIEFGDPPKVDGFVDYMRAGYREIAAGMGISYEALTGDLSNVNFSSGRMGWLEFQRSIDAWREHMLIPQFCHPVARWFLAGAVLVTGNNAPASVWWTSPRREMINPTLEVPAAVAAIRGGLSSRSHEQRKLGFDPDDLMAEQIADNAAADEAGLIFDSDSRRVSQAGLYQGDTGGDAQQ
ncbi:phage portal protein [Acuticoccus sp. M5D2P5]|uniref:phage portal protein n=1 Tax=Acuticoccus kalidii TaxID=2910977 RepID=UPI001F318C45|nr:phage portal protein [Acuticoccus kalidii]MCF3935017.1 phage portal protein [Acuticoccus kalidii]